MPTTLRSRLAKFARIAAKIAGGLLAFVLVLVLAWVLLNSFDAPLSDQAKALLAPPQNASAAADNLYLAMAGMEGAAQRPIVDMGQERVEAYNQALDSILLNPDAALKLNRKWDSADFAFAGKLELGSQRSGSIWTAAKSHRQEIAALLASNQTLYQRYLSLHRLHGYYETVRPSYLAPVVSTPQQVRVLFLGDVANRVQTGTLQQQREALTDLQLDLQIWRTVLKGDGTLIGKMLAAAWLHADLVLLADLIADPNIDLKPLDDVLDPTLSPFGPQDYQIGNAFAAEFRGAASLYKTITAPNEWGAPTASSWRQRTWNAVQAYFFKVNATENMSAAMAAQWVALGNSDPSQFYRNRDAYRAWLQQYEPHLSLRALYNPVGNILVKIAAPQNDAYSLRVYDVAAYQRLVYLAYQLKRHDIAVADIPAFLTAHPEWSTHPVDGRPFRWNPETRELAVNTLGERSKDWRFSIGPI